MSVPNSGAWKGCICVIHASLQAEHLHMCPELSSALAARGVCVSPQTHTNTCALARGTNQSSWPETSREITSTRAGKNSECSWVHVCILSENKMCWANVSEKWGILHKAISKCPKLKCKLRVQGQNWCPGSKFPIQTIVLTKVTKNAKLLWI